MEARETGIIAWFTRNRVAANLLMFLIIIAGVVSIFTIRKQMFPTIEPNTIMVRVIYPGAAPQEVEQGVIVRIEDAIDEIEGIRAIRSTSREGMGTVTIEVASGYETQEVMDEVRMNVDSIASFPAQIEPPLVYRMRPQQAVIWVSIFGDIDERSRKNLAKSVRDDIRSLRGISRATVVGARNDEIAIEISEHDLRQFGLTFNDVVQAVRGTSIDVPGGSIRTPNGDILLRAKGQGYTGRDFEDIILLRRDDGTRLRLGDIAVVNDGFVESRAFAEFDGSRATFVRVDVVGDQDELAVARAVKEYVDARQDTMPQGVNIAYWGDRSFYLQGRLDLMLKNMYFGIALVFIALTLFLQLRLAFWVMIGLPVCFLGALAMMNLNMFDVSINMISLFGFILVLGIVVDDAIIIGESAYSEIEKYGKSEENVIRGAKRVAVPATFGVLTTIVAFMPMLFVGGTQAPIWESIAYVVIFCLIFSLIESKWILPAHINGMKYSKTPDAKQNRFQRFRNTFAEGLKGFVENRYKPFAELCLRHRYTTISAFIALMIIMFGLLGGGLVRFVFFPNLPSDFIQANLEMQPGTNEERTIQNLRSIREVMLAMNEEYEAQYGSSLVRHVNVFLNSPETGTIFIELEKSERREIDGFAVINEWRERTPEIPGARDLNFSANFGPGGGYDVEFLLSGTNLEELAGAARALRTELAQYGGVFDITDTFGIAREEVQLNLLPQADALGLSLQDVALQVRQAFFGAEAQRLPRNDEEVRVMIRYPLEERRSIGNLESMMIRTADGREVPFREVAVAQMGEGFGTINRINGVRAVTVRARVDKDRVEPGVIVRDIRDNYLPEILENYPNVRFGLEGASLEQAQALVALAWGALAALVGIYVLMAIPLKSYLQPLLIMSVIPFGVIGAIFGHFVLGMPLSLLSLFGIIALAGVVVNDSLILVDYVNKTKSEFKDLREAVVNAGAARFRAIVLTSLTTFLGLTPIVLERSLQAQMVIPMAVSLAFGILFATVITLLLIPCLYLVQNDFKQLFGLGRKEVLSKEEFAELKAQGNNG
ncbi:efflux RND transporter permease subunit [Aliidiomarina sanyensis]|uniref:Acriflavin resistance protein n=1 Tax=Aliidiomarina sanyensis TaxID=1249555 RepID=A0A432WN86_9GAMM|nr:efflux RND transporter permease subunit [Aliidiomarina sanyensis]RUO35253.1 acriflavin resistance protein [Aliidiomarina sanyensis]